MIRNITGLLLLLTTTAIVLPYGYCHVKGTAEAYPAGQVPYAVLNNKKPQPNYVAPNADVVLELLPKKLPQELGFVRPALENATRGKQHPDFKNQEEATRVCSSLGLDWSGKYFNTAVPAWDRNGLYTKHGITLFTDNCVNDGDECYATNTRQLGICLRPVHSRQLVCNANAPMSRKETAFFLAQLAITGQELKTDAACKGRYPEAPCACNNTRKLGVCGISRNAPNLEANTMYCHCD